MTTIAQGSVENFFVALLPRVAFGNEDARTPGASFGVGTVSNPFSNTVAHPDYATLEGGLLTTVSVNRDGSVVGSNARGGQVMIASEKRQELVPFNAIPKPFSASLPGAQALKQLSPKAIGWTAVISLLAGALLLL